MLMEILKSTFYLLIFVECVQISEAKWSAEGRIEIRLFIDGPSIFIEEQLERGVNILTSHHYNASLPMVILIHGMDATVECGFVEDSVKAMFAMGLNSSFNIVALNLPELMAIQNVFDKYLYRTALNSQIAGDAVGDFLVDAINQKLLSPVQIHVVGYSMGAQVAGYLARKVKEAHGLIRYIMGLDPAGIGFTPNTLIAWYSGLVHVSAADAQHVDFMHCNSIGLGTVYRNATANFVFNGGNLQPGCSTSANLGCSHNKVPFYFIESIFFPESFIARKCDSLNNFLACHCNFEETLHISFPPDFRAKGDYYLTTNAETPFGQKEAGIKCTEETEVIQVKEKNVLEDKKLKIKKVQTRRRYVKKVHNSQHITKSKNISQGDKHRTMDEYEKMRHRTAPDNHGHKMKPHAYRTQSQLTPTENNSPIDDVMDKFHHHIVDEP